MNADGIADLARRAAAHAALGDPARLRIVDHLLLGDAAPSELSAMLDMPSNLLAHHVRALERAGLVTRRRSEGDGRRTYLHLADEGLELVSAPRPEAPGRVLFVCSANSARSQLATALWRRASAIPAVSAGTHPADRIAPGAVDAARRHGLPLPRRRPRHLDDVYTDGDLVVSVCDRAHEELGPRSALHWSVADPVRGGTRQAFDTAYDELAGRVASLARRVLPD
jgi:protein-tyrosine-phosphatase/DNA-binding HxlR family transcriptional regulator